jgi:hypothetical protein
MAHLVSTETIRQALQGLMPDLAFRLAPQAGNWWIDAATGRYWTLNPGRADTRVGSFFVELSGDNAGRWHDFATGDHGDIIDLVGLALNLSPRDRFAEARRIAGLEAETPQSKADREKRAQEARQRRRRQEADRRAELDRRRRKAAGLWLACRPEIRGTPVEHYLRGRGIDLAAFGRQPACLRYHPELRYGEDRVDPETGEVTELRWKFPAMVTAMVRGGQIVAVHRTWLALDDSGRWDKAPVRKPKKEWGDPKGATINLWTGTGPRGGKAARLAECPPGTRLYIAEGIETALSAVMLHPEARVIAAATLGNMADVVLPANVAEVVLIQDHDESAAAKAAFARAVAAHTAAGRVVRVHKPEAPEKKGFDLNDELRRAIRMEGAA